MDVTTWKERCHKEIVRWLRGGITRVGDDGQIVAKLLALPDDAEPEAIEAIIGTLGTRVPCVGCRKMVTDTIEIYDSCQICRDCVNKMPAMFEAKTSDYWQKQAAQDRRRSRFRGGRSW